jgi:DNA gyrase subunit A
LDDPETGEANYRITNRGGKGVKTINVTEKTGNLVGLLDVTEKQDLMITCVSGVTIRMSVASVSEQGRATQGVKLIKVDEGDRIAAITKLDEEPEAPDEVIEEGDQSINVEGTSDSTQVEDTNSPVSPDSE